MKTSFVAIAALAMLSIPAVASAAGLQYDPASKENGESHFVVATTVANPANAEAAAADAARYTNSGTALIATHGDTGAKVVLEANPLSGSNEPRFIKRVVVVNPANAEAAAADAARFPAPVYYSSDSADEAAKIRG